MFGFWAAAQRIGRNFFEDLASLPLYAMALLALILAAGITAMSQWLSFPQPTPVTQNAASSPAKTSDVTSGPSHSSPDKADDQFPAQTAPQHGLSSSFSIIDPQVGPDGSIKGDERPAFFLSELKPFSAQDVCIRASGVRWACGLQAYARLHNGVAKKKIDCINKGSAEYPEISCQLAGENLALVLVRPGLAELKDDVRDPALLKAQADAKTERSGIWDR